MIKMYSYVISALDRLLKIGCEGPQGIWVRQDGDRVLEEGLREANYLASYLASYVEESVSVRLLHYTLTNQGWNLYKALEKFETALQPQSLPTVAISNDK